MALEIKQSRKFYLISQILVSPKFPMTQVGYLCI